MSWKVKKDQNAEKKHARALEGNLGAQNSRSASPASWPLLMKPEHRGRSPCLPSVAHDGEPSQSQGSPGCRPTQKSRNLAPAQVGSLFCIVRAPGEVRTWSSPDGSLRPHPENHESTVQACSCQDGHLSGSASPRGPGHTEFCPLMRLWPGLG